MEESDSSRWTLEFDELGQLDVVERYENQLRYEGDVVINAAMGEIYYIFSI